MNLLGGWLSKQEPYHFSEEYSLNELIYVNLQPVREDD